MRHFLDDRQIQGFADLQKWKYAPTARQRDAINKWVERKKNSMTFREAFTEKFVSDKFGEAPTHWRKLEDRVHRGVGNVITHPLSFEAGDRGSGLAQARMPTITLKGLAPRSLAVSTVVRTSASA